MRPHRTRELEHAIGKVAYGGPVRSGSEESDLPPRAVRRCADAVAAVARREACGEPVCCLRVGGVPASWRRRAFFAALARQRPGQFVIRVSPL